MPFVTASWSHWKDRISSMPCDAYDCAASDIELNSASRFACEYAKKTPVSTITAIEKAIKTSTRVKASFALRHIVLVQILIRDSDLFDQKSASLMPKPPRKYYNNNLQNNNLCHKPARKSQ